jgi:hypothetical protein
MSTIVIDAAMRERFLAAGGVVEVRDESGEVLGRFIRTGSPVPPPGYVIEGEWPSDEEIDRRLKTGAWHSAAEVEAFLAGLKRGAK